MKLNVIVPLAGPRSFKLADGENFPKILSEINGKLLLEHSARSIFEISEDLNIIVIVPEAEAKRYSLGNILRSLDDRIKVLMINGETAGAACTSLYAIDELAQGEPLIVTSFEQVFDLKLKPHIKRFMDSGADCGVLTFSSMHPRFSYVLTDADNTVLQAAEKKPISKNAVAGLYYFGCADEFVDAAKLSVINNALDSGYYISNTINEYILSGKLVKSIPIPKTSYHHIYDFQDIELLRSLSAQENLEIDPLVLTNEYIRCFNSKESSSISNLLDEKVILREPNLSVQGKAAVMRHILTIFESCKNLTFEGRRVFVDGRYSIIEFELSIDQESYLGTDVIEWTIDGKIRVLNAYFSRKEN